MSGILNLRNKLGLVKAPEVKAPIPEPEVVEKNISAPPPPLFNPLTSQEVEWSGKLLDTLLANIDLTALQSLDKKRARSEIKEIGLSTLREMNAPISDTTAHKVIKIVEDDIMGLGPLEPMLAETTVSDIIVNRYDQIYIGRKGRREVTPIRFRDHEHLMRVIEKIVSKVGRRVDESNPIVDARLLDGSRVNVVIPPVALDGAYLSIRKFSRDLLTMENMIKLNSISAPMAEFLNAIVKGRLNVVVSGGTGSGKTTMLNILSSFIPHTESIITIEDSAELQLRQPNIRRMETRPPNIEGKGEINQRDLVVASLRMFPDRIIIGEVRKQEAFDMLQAMNTGHDGSLTTIHANTPRDALTRIENMVAMSGLDLPSRTVRAQIASAINVVVQLERHEDGGRRVVSISEINGMEGDVITMSEIFKFVRQGLDEEGNVLGEFVATNLIPSFFDKLRAKGINISRSTFSNPISEVKEKVGKHHE